MAKLLEEELSYKVRGSIYDTANKYGKGLKESIYQKALAEEFDKNNIKYEQQKRINIHSVAARNNNVWHAFGNKL